MKAILCVIVMLTVVTYAYATDEATTIKNEAFDNISSEFITCAGYAPLPVTPDLCRRSVP